MITWTTRDILQQIAHFTQGFVYTLILSFIVMPFPVWYFGALFGVGVELYQYLGPDNRDPRIGDRIRDWAFWAFGGLATLLF